jgi:PAS domain S-box-containing protein
MAAFLGCTPAELGERTIFDFLDETGGAAVREAFGASGPEWGRRDLRFRRPAGGEVWGSVRVTPLVDDAGKRTGVLAMVNDITDRKRAEEQIRGLNEELGNRIRERTAQLENMILALQVRNLEVERANQLKSEFLASVSHELRTPLNAILGFAELLEEESTGELNEKQRRFADHILGGAQHLLEVINDILDLSSIEAGKVKLNCEPLEVRQAVEDALDGIRPMAAGKGIHLRVEAEEVPAVQADPVRLKQILYNLLSNAVKFTGPGGAVWVEVREDGGAVAVAVCDNGVGIPAEEHEAIFNEFYQVGTTTRGVKEGTGLGLPITRLLVEQQGGMIRVESQPGRGSRFVFTLPALVRQPA